MSRGSRAFGALAAIAVGLFAGRARADGPVAHTYAIQNVDAYPGKVFVAWPRTCGAAGGPLGAVSLQLNPDWAARQHEVDYEVIRQGAVHQVMPYCLATMRIYALPAEAFARASRVATADDVSLGKKAGETFDILPALDALDLQKRPSFFADDPRKVASPFRFDAPLPGNAPAVPAAARAVHRDLVIEPSFVASPPSFALVTSHVRVSFDKPTPDSDVYPSDAGAATADAGVVAAAPAPASSPRGDGGTRWVYAAAIGGLVAGGLIARYRKRKDAK